MSRLHTLLLESANNVRTDTNYEGLPLVVRGFSVRSGLDEISIEPAEFKDRAKKKPKFNKIRVFIKALEENKLYDEKNPVSSPVNKYTFVQEMSFVDFARQLLGWAKNGTDELKIEAGRSSRITNTPTFGSFIIEPAVVAVWLRFFDVLNEEKSPLMTQSRVVSLASTSTAVRKASVQRVSAKPASSRPTPLIGPYYAKFLKDSVCISVKSTPIFKVEIKQCKRSGDQQECRFQFRRRLDGRLKPYGPEEAFTRDEVLSMCYHYVHTYGDKIDDMDSFTEMSSAPKHIKDKFVDFTQDEHGVELGLPIQFVCAIYTFARKYWAKKTEKETLKEISVA